jgi:hypothetical protein
MTHHKKPFAAMPKSKQPQREPDDFYVITFRTRDEDRCWEEWMSFIGTYESLSRQFNLEDLPLGVFLRKGADARRYLARAFQAEKDYQRVKARGPR